jgi:DNA-binding phage protein
VSLTREFKDLVKARLDRDPAARRALLQHALESLLNGDVTTGKRVLRDYINATLGFEKLASATGTPSKSLMRMFSAAGNPRSENLFAVLRELQKAAQLQVRVRISRESERSA